MEVDRFAVDFQTLVAHPCDVDSLLRKTWGRTQEFRLGTAICSQGVAHRVSRRSGMIKPAIWNINTGSICVEQRLKDGFLDWRHPFEAQGIRSAGDGPIRTKALIPLGC